MVQINMERLAGKKNKTKLFLWIKNHHLGPTVWRLIRLLSKHATRVHLFLLLMKGHLPKQAELR